MPNVKILVDYGAVEGYQVGDIVDLTDPAALIAEGKVELTDKPVSIAPEEEVVVIEPIAVPEPVAHEVEETEEEEPTEEEVEEIEEPETAVTAAAETEEE